MSEKDKKLVDKIVPTLVDIWLDGVRCASTPMAIPDLFLERQARGILTKTAELTRKELVEWLEGWCEHTTNPLQRRYLCQRCRKALKGS